eukprot:7375875-Pyramimonas_sp.AAC.1
MPESLRDALFFLRAPPETGGAHFYRKRADVVPPRGTGNIPPPPPRVLPIRPWPWMQGSRLRLPRNSRRLGRRSFSWGERQRGERGRKMKQKRAMRMGMRP